MSAGHLRDSDPPTSALRALVTPEVRSEIEQLISRASVDRTHDVLWMGGRSRDLSRVNVDPRVPSEIDGLDTGEGLKRHEIPEGYFQNVMGLPYHSAHVLATYLFEKPFVESKIGPKGWSKWEGVFDSLVVPNEHEKIKNPDPEADLAPYLSDGTKAEIKKMQGDQGASQTPDQALGPDAQPSLGQGAEAAGQDPSSGGLQIQGLDALKTQHTQLAAMNKKMSEASSTLRKVREGMDRLTALGDIATQDDVVGEAGKLVGHGLDPGAVASLLADMPEGGEPLKAWIAQHDLQIKQREAQQTQVHDQVRHELATTALRVLFAHHAMDMHQGIPKDILPQQGGDQPETPSAPQTGVAGNALGASPMMGSA
jgi:hypothetical protein